MNNIKHIFFDLDHTIWDFESNSREALQELFLSFESQLNGVNYESFIQLYEGINAAYWDRYRMNQVTKEQLRIGRFVDAFAQLNFPITRSFASDFADAYLACSPYKTNLFTGAHEVLTYLKSKYQLHIITNGFVEVQHVKLASSKLTAYFDLVLCSDEVGIKKPDPQIFEIALEKTGAIASESMMIGDCIDADVKGGVSVGMSAIHFDPFQKTKQLEFKSIQSLLELKYIL